MIVTAYLLGYTAVSCPSPALTNEMEYIQKLKSRSQRRSVMVIEPTVSSHLNAKAR